MAATASGELVKPGSRVRLIGDHPHAGCRGVYLRDEPTMAGWRPVVKLDGDQPVFLQAVFVMRPGLWELECPHPLTCRWCGLRRTHNLTGTLVCAKCD